MDPIDNGRKPSVPDDGKPRPITDQWKKNRKADKKAELKKIEAQRAARRARDGV